MNTSFVCMINISHDAYMLNSYYTRAVCMVGCRLAVRDDVTRSIRELAKGDTIFDSLRRQADECFHGFLAEIWATAGRFSGTLTHGQHGAGDQAPLGREPTGEYPRGENSRAFETVSIKARAPISSPPECVPCCYSGAKKSWRSLSIQGFLSRQPLAFLDLLTFSGIIHTLWRHGICRR